jgi:hypothetical protein
VESRGNALRYFSFSLNPFSRNCFVSDSLQFAFSVGRWGAVWAKHKTGAVHTFLVLEKKN